MQTMTASYPTVPTICEIAAISASVVDAIAAGRTGLGCSWQLRVRRLHWLRGLSSGHGSLAGSAGATRCCSRGAAKKTAAQSKAAQVQTDRLVAGLQLPRLNGQGLQRRRGGVLPRRVNGEMPRRGLLKIRGQDPALAEPSPRDSSSAFAAFMCRLHVPPSCPLPPTFAHAEVMRRSALCAVLCLACISSDVPCSSCTRGPALQLRGGGTELGSTAGKGHSSVFLEDAARRKADADAAHSVAEPPSERTPEEILRGAMLREQAAQSRQEAAKLSVAALRSKLRALGASDASMGACTEKSDLVDLLTSLENTAQVVRVRTESRGTDSFKMPKMAADIAEFVTSLEAPKSTGKAEGNRTWPSTSQVSAESMAAGTKKLADLGRPTDGQTSPQQPARQTSMTAERVADGAREGMEQEEQKDDDDVGEVLEEREGRSEDEEDLRAEGAHAAIDYGSRRVAVAGTYLKPSKCAPMYIAPYQTRTLIHMAANLYETRHLPDSQRLQRMEQWLKSRPITYLREQLTTHGIR